MDNRVLVLDANREPLMPCHPARARKLLKFGRASIFRRQPFTIILHDRKQEDSDLQSTQVKIDPGAKTTGLALVAGFINRGPTLLWAAELHHRSYNISKKLADRRALRRGRRSRKTRYRKPRFINRTRPKGWLPPSLQHRVETTMTWVNRLTRWTPIVSVSLEHVKFDTQALENPAMGGTDYQNGALAGYELREYLLQRHGHTCAYCEGLSKDPILEQEHVRPKSRGGSNRLANQVIACRSCNVAKGNQMAGEWVASLKKSNALNRKRADKAEKIQRGQRPSLQGAAAVNATRWKLYERLKARAPIELGSGGRTKYNRTSQGYPKAHWIDAACVGPSGEAMRLDPRMTCLAIQSIGQGERKRIRPDKNGFARFHKVRQKSSHGYKTGDMVKIQTGKYAGGRGRCWVRFKKPSFLIETAKDRVTVHLKHLVRIHRQDGYVYEVT